MLATVAFDMNFGGEAALPYVTVPLILGVTSAVDVADGVGVFVAVFVGVFVGVLVAVRVGVNVGVKVGVAVLVAVTVGADVGVFVGVTLGVPIGPDVRGHAKAPRPRVQSNSVVLPRSIDISQIITAGRPLLNRDQTGVAALISLVK